MRDAGMCGGESRKAIGKPHIASLSSSTRNFHARSRSLMIRFQPKRHTLKYGLFCSLLIKNTDADINISQFSHSRSIVADANFASLKKEKVFESSEKKIASWTQTVAFASQHLFSSFRKHYKKRGNNDQQLCFLVFQALSLG